VNGTTNNHSVNSPSLLEIHILNADNSVHSQTSGESSIYIGIVLEPINLGISSVTISRKVDITNQMSIISESVSMRIDGINQRSIYYKPSGKMVSSL